MNVLYVLRAPASGLRSKPVLLSIRHFAKTSPVQRQPAAILKTDGMIDWDNYYPRPAMCACLWSLRSEARQAANRAASGNHWHVTAGTSVRPSGPVPLHGLRARLGLTRAGPSRRDQRTLMSPSRKLECPAGQRCTKPA